MPGPLLGGGLLFCDPRFHDLNAVLPAARWRHEQSVRRTATRRPDLLSPSVLREDVVVRRVEPGDAGEPRQE